MYIRFFFILLFSTILFNSINSFAVIGWKWAKSGSGSNDDIPQSVTVDNLGNVYISGGFFSSTLTLGTTTLTNAGASDVFVAKYNSSGNLIWAKSAGGINDDVAPSIATDASGNVYITGSFFSPSITFGGITLTKVGGTDMFLVKYDSSGNVIWAKRAGGVSNEHGLALKVNSTGDIYVTGKFQGATMVFGTTTLIGSGVYDIFLVKYNSLGDVIWAKSAGGNYEDNPSSLTIDEFENVYITGSYQSSTLTFGSTTLTNSTTPYFDIFLAKYDSSGLPLWARSAIGSGSEYSKSVSTDVLGNVFIAGYFFSDTLMFDAAALSNAGSGSYDIFLVKYDSYGNLQWAKGFGGSNYDYGFSVTTDATNSIYLAGSYQSATLTFDTITLTNSGHTNSCIVKFDPSGNAIWAESIADTGYEVAYSIALDASQNIYFTGSYQSSSLTFGTSTITNSGAMDIFLAKYQQSTVYIPEITESNNPLCIYPNPSFGTIMLSKNNETDISSITISDMLGRKQYYQNSIHAFPININLSTFPNLDKPEPKRKYLTL